MSRTFIAVVALGAALAACKRPREADASREVLRQSMRGVLAYPRSSIVSTIAGTDAGQVTLTSPTEVDTIAAWYRLALKLNGWTLQNDSKAADGTISLYAEQGSKPLWITLKPNVGAPGTTYTLIGAAVDTAGVDTTARKDTGRH
jgi:hypothetical protein